eukprot:3288268-Rhodomonas_salina.3
MVMFVDFEGGCSLRGWRDAVGAGGALYYREERHGGNLKRPGEMEDEASIAGGAAAVGTRRSEGREGASFQRSMDSKALAHLDLSSNRIGDEGAGRLGE